MTRRRRLAGILCPVSALPGRFGIGDFGPRAYDFIDWLATAGQTYWQVLPLTVPDHIGSPYASPSSLAGSWLYLSPEMLQRQGLWSRSKKLPASATRRLVNYGAVAKRKEKILWQSFLLFQRLGNSPARRQHDRFVAHEGAWLAEFSLFHAIKDSQAGRPWWLWPEPYQRLSSAQRTIDQKILQRQKFHAFLQWQFAEQWDQVKKYAHQQGIQIIGDIPFYVQRDSVDVWAHPELFLLDRQRRPLAVAGAPADFFRLSGQYWGNPLYRWAAHQRTRFAWWTQRMTLAVRRYDLVRFDHFRGLISTWHIPAKHKDPRIGHWIATPGQALLSRWQRLWPRLPIVAEDLGQPSPLVDKLRRKFHLDSIRIMIYAWNGLPKNIHHPQFLNRDTFYYSSTHDTNPVIGWWQREAKPYEQKMLKEYLGLRSAPTNWQWITALYRNREHVAMVAIQDVLGLGAAARFNTPGKKRGNWQWRLPVGGLTAGSAKKLRSLVYQSKL